MLDIYSFPVYYIGMNRSLKLEEEIRAAGWSNVNHFQAINGKAQTALQWLQDGTITLRAYNDLIAEGRHDHAALPSLGAIGCYLSHLAIWKLAIANGHPYVIIMEDDILLGHKLSTTDLSKIRTILEKPNSLYISAWITHPTPQTIFFYFAHFYICKLETCRSLVEYALPIDIQVDVYMAYLANTGKITVEGFMTYRQRIHLSSIQHFCLKCFIPPDNFKITLGLTILVLLLSLGILKCRRII